MCLGLSVFGGPLDSIRSPSGLVFLIYIYVSFFFSLYIYIHVYLTYSHSHSSPPLPLLHRSPLTFSQFRFFLVLLFFSFLLFSLLPPTSSRAWIRGRQFRSDIFEDAFSFPPPPSPRQVLTRSLPPIPLGSRIPPFTPPLPSPPQVASPPLPFPFPPTSLLKEIPSGRQHPRRPNSVPHRCRSAFPASISSPIPLPHPRSTPSIKIYFRWERNESVRRFGRGRGWVGGGEGRGG